jgi:RNA polymerase sigma factor (sigma-70 family)
LRFDCVPAELVERCRAGHPDALDSLCRSIQDDLYAFILSHVRHTDDAADLLQDCLIRVCRSISTLREPSRFAPWIMRMALNLCHSHFANPGKGRVVFMEDLATPIEPQQLAASSAPPPSPRDATAAKEIQDFINSAIGDLPQKQKAAILLYEVEHLPVKKIAELLECSEGAVKFNLHEARNKLRIALKNFAGATPLPSEART